MAALLCVLSLILHLLCSPSSSSDCPYYLQPLGPSAASNAVPLPINSQCVNSTASHSYTYSCSGLFVWRLYEFKYSGPNCKGSYTTTVTSCDAEYCSCTGSTEGQCSGTTFSVNGHSVTVLLDQCIDSTVYTLDVDGDSLRVETYDDSSECSGQPTSSQILEYSLDDSNGNGGDGHGDSEPSEDETEGLVVTDRKLLDLIIICSGLLLSICAVCCAAVVHRKMRQYQLRRQRQRGGLGAKLVPKKKKKKKEDELRKEGVPEMVYDEEDAPSDSGGVEVDEIALVAVPMPAFAADVIAPSPKESEREMVEPQNDADDAAENEDEDEDGNDIEAESEGEGEGQGFEESD